MNFPIPYNTGLPIYSRKDDIIRLVRTCQVVIVSGTTGSGKTTQLPLMCLEAGRGTNGQIGVTQPRRIAATSIARRVAEELSGAVGSLVGYKTRFESQESASTIVRFMTDGVMLSEIASDRMLRRYDTIIIDEVHERSLNIDFLLGYLRTILSRRKDLRLIISSATADTQLFSKIFGNAPVVDVEGKLFPVEVVYMPFGQTPGEGDYLDAAQNAIESLVDDSENGDILVFLPTEWDIMELYRNLTAKRFAYAMILPLFARLPKKQQDLIFRESGKQKIILASPVAETSITIPNIRYVVDTGLARIKRFTPHTRVTCLPIENVSRASADQRKGRCGRVREGMCVRLYSEEDYQSREPFTMPEIMRSNLSDVILRMALLGIGPIEEFPFIDPPAGRAVADGYAHLRELGAFSVDNKLTKTGKKMAGLSIDCHVARMIVSGVEENSLREILIIASGLSVIDPRQRPPGKEKEADGMHARFTDPLSDFLFYLKAWDAFHDEFTRTKSKTHVRRFCEQHFLSFTRMNEWQDLHNQITHQAKSIGCIANPHAHADYPAIHRAIMAGLISSIAQKQEDGTYRSARGRVFKIFPGSALFKKKPLWIVCHEMVETSAVYARGVASIDPAWIEELTPHLCRYNYGDPYFDEVSGSVKAPERVSFYGFTLGENRTVHYGRINPQAATDIFIRQGLVEEKLQTRHSFIRKNHELKEKIKSAEAKLRTSGLIVDDAALFQFYSKRLPGVYSTQELNRCILEHQGDSFLCFSENDLLARPLPNSINGFPDSVTIGSVQFPLVYRCASGGEDDGATLCIPEAALPYIGPSLLNWLVPGMRFDQVLWILRECPKNVRSKLMPLEETARTIAANLSYSGIGLVASICGEIEKLSETKIPAGFPKDVKLPEHLSIHCAIVDDDFSHEKKAVKSVVSQKLNQNRSIEAWRKAFTGWNKEKRVSWDFGDLDARIPILESSSGFPLYGYPAIEAHENCVNCILCTSAAEAKKVHAKGVARLLELCLADELALFEHEAGSFGKGKLAYAALPEIQQIRRNCVRMVQQAAVGADVGICRNQKQFKALVDSARTKVHQARCAVASTLETLSTEFMHCAKQLGSKRKTLLNSAYVKIHDELSLDLERYTKLLVDPQCFLELFIQLPRYVSALVFRIDKAFAEPIKYNQRIESVRLWEQRLLELQNKQNAGIDSKLKCNDLTLMIEEFKVSLFAQQEIKTLFPISEKRLEEKFKEISGL
jgi:ATP-dependent helicase HrpA